jgi:hypothetical protein
LNPFDRRRGCCATTSGAVLPKQRGASLPVALGEHRYRFCFEALNGPVFGETDRVSLR